ncbi:MAG: hypothetical protein Q9222_000710 [Ikaeria aurantiellina]
MSVQSGARIGIFFISSISAVMDWPAGHNGPVPEEIVDDFTVPAAMGYAESKHVAERLLSLAYTNCQIPISICRVGQIAGPVLSSKGVWNKREWFPMVASCRYLGCIPDSLGDSQQIDWVPIDILSTIIMELSLQPTNGGSKLGARVYHVTNPNPTTWDTLLPSVKADMSPQAEVVPLATWTKRLQDSIAGSDTPALLAQNPAAKLLGFYEGLLETGRAPTVLSTVEAQKVSATLRALEPVSRAWVTKWLQQWREAQ